VVEARYSAYIEPLRGSSGGPARDQAGVPLGVVTSFRDNDRPAPARPLARPTGRFSRTQSASRQAFRAAKRRFPGGGVTTPAQRLAGGGAKPLLSVWRLKPTRRLCIFMTFRDTRLPLASSASYLVFYCETLCAIKVGSLSET